MAEVNQDQHELQLYNSCYLTETSSDTRTRNSVTKPAPQTQSLFTPAVNQNLLTVSATKRIAEMATTTTSYGYMTGATTGDYGGTETSTTIDAMRNKFHTADWIVFSLMVVVSVVIGVISAVRNRTKNNTQEYLLGGRNMPPFAVAISLLGGIISSISVLGKHRVPLTLVTRTINSRTRWIIIRPG